MTDSECWPPQQAIQPSVESKAVLKAGKELCKVVVDDTDKLCGS